MAIPFLNHLDLQSVSELQNAILHKTTSGAASNVEGKIIYDTGSNTLKYYNGSPVIKKIKRISKPGIRKYSKISELNKPFGGLGISIISTPKGVMSDHQAKKNNVGGEILCEVF